MEEVFLGLTFAQLVAIALPLLLVDLGMKIFCIVKLIKEGGRHLPDWAWALILLLVNFGWIIFLIFGKRRY